MTCIAVHSDLGENEPAVLLTPPEIDRVAASGFDGEQTRAMRWANAAVFMVVMVVAVITLWQWPSRVASTLHLPDGVEYAAGADQFAQNGRYEIIVGGKAYPPRYPPFFSIVVLSPVYFLGGELGHGVLPVFALALCGIVGAYVAGYRIAGVWGASAAASALLAFPLYATLARTIMTDAPMAALFTVGLAIFMGNTGLASSRTRWFAVAGFLAAAAGATRLFGSALAGPFFLDASRRRGLSGALAMLLIVCPLLIALALTAWYNDRTFGDPSRSGYHFWCPVPYDYPGGAFSARYLFHNLMDLFKPAGLLFPVVIGTSGWIALRWRDRAMARRVALFIFTSALPVTVAHLFYYLSNMRFHLPLAAVCLAAGAAGWMTLIPRSIRLRCAPIAIILPLATLFVPHLEQPDAWYDEWHRELAVLRQTPDDAVIITGLDPVRLESLLLRGTARTWVAASRRQEYANKMVAPFRVDPRLAPLPWPGAHRHPLLLRCGARDAVEWTANEKPEMLAQWMRDGREVYFDTRLVPPGSAQHGVLARDFYLTPAAKGSAIFRLSSKGNANASPATDATEPGLD